MWLIKVQYTKYKNPRWVVVREDKPDEYRRIQKSRKTASRFSNREAAEKVAEPLRVCNLRKVEVVACF
jgi:hypothetical protein